MGISQAVLAERVGTSTHYIAQIEQQNRFPSYVMMERLAVALEFDSVELFSVGPYTPEAIQQFHDDMNAAFEKSLKKLEKSNKSPLTLE